MTTLFMRYFAISLSMLPFILLLLVSAQYTSKKYRPAWKNWVWLFIVLRMVVPIPFTLLPAPIQVEVPAPVLPRLPRPAGYSVGAPSAVAPSQGLAAPLPQVAPSCAPASQWTVLQLLAFIWVAGCVAVLILQLLQYFLFKRNAIRWGVPHAQIQAVTANYAAKYKVKCAVYVLISKKVHSPMVMGYTKQYLLLPHAKYTPTELKYILQHELNHIAKKHGWYKLLVLLAVSLHWFNPVVWFMRRDISRCLEISCDADVAAHCTNLELAEYGNTLLSVACCQPGGVPLLATSMGARKKAMVDRILCMVDLQNKKKGYGLAIGCVAALVLAGSLVGCVAGAGKSNDETAREPSEPVQSQSVPEKEPQSVPDAGFISESQPDESMEQWYALVKNQQDDFAKYAQKSGLSMGYHVGSVSINTGNIPQGVDPHGFLTPVESMSLHQLLNRRDQWIEEGVNGGWLVDEDHQLKVQIITLVHNGGVEAPYITSVIPSGNVFFDVPFFEGKEYSAFEFEGGQEQELLWFYDVTQKRITRAGTWQNARMGLEGVYFADDKYIKSMADDLVYSSANANFVKLIQNSAEEEWKDVISFTVWAPVEGTQYKVLALYVVDTHSYNITFVSAYAVENSGGIEHKPVIWDKAYEKHLLPDEEVQKMAQSLVELYSIANSLV